MGVLNVTPDSFSDGGRCVDIDAALECARRMRSEGAAIIDVGGESTRPGAAPVAIDEEMRRVLPVVRALVQEGFFVSVDTRKPEVMRAAIDVGVQMINDVQALREPGALEAVAESSVYLCLMHMQGEPRSMQQAPRYGDVVGEVIEFLRQRIERCVEAGIRRERLILDPGFGFGKTVEHNLTLLRELAQLCALELPVLAGLSRKSLLGVLTGRPVDERLAGSLALAYAALEGGARIIRCHDVAQTVDLLKVWWAVRASRREG
jgi:dihydropteroate synthase